MSTKSSIPSPKPVCNAILAAGIAAFPNIDISDNSSGLYSRDEFQPQACDIFSCYSTNGRLRLIESLRSLPEKFHLADWDGYGAKPLSSNSWNHAISFVKKLPDMIGDPEADVDAEGDVTIEWYLGKGRQCLLTFSDEGNLYCRQITPNKHDLVKLSVYDLATVLRMIEETLNA